MHTNNESGIVFDFTHSELQGLLQTKLAAYPAELGKIESKIQDLKHELDLLAKNGRSRTPEYGEKEQEISSFESLMDELKAHGELLSFYAAHLPAGTIMLTLNDVRLLGLVPFERGMMAQVKRAHLKG